MKRFLSLFVTLAMLLSFGLTLTACKDGGKTDETQPETLGDPVKDPTVVSNVYANTMTAFVGDDAAAAVLQKALLKGSIGITFATEMEDGSPIRLEETIYTDTAGGRFVSETLLSMMGESMTATIWGDRTGVTVGSEALFGNKNSYTVNLDTLLSGLRDSDLAKLLEIPAEEMDEVLDLIKQFKDSLSPAAPGSEVSEALELYDRLYALCNPTTEQKVVTAEDGTETEYLIVTYTINNESVKGLLDIIADSAIDLVGDMATAEDADGLKASMDEIKEELDAGANISIVEKVYILTEKQVVEKTEVTFDLTPVVTPVPLASDGDVDAVEFAAVSGTMNTAFSADKIALELEISSEGETIKASATVDKKVEGDTTTYTAALSGGTKNVTMDVLNITLSYNKATGDLTLDGDIMADETARIDFGAKATYKVTETEIAFTLLSLTADGETISFSDKDNELSITVKALTEIPTAPADAKDIVTMTEEELTELLTAITESPIAQLFGSMVEPEEPEEALVGHFINDELFLATTSDYREVEVDGFIAAFDTDETAILVLREDRADCVAVGIEDLDMYTEIVLKNNGLSMSDLDICDGVSYFEYTYTANGFRYLAVPYETADAYWLINFAAPEESYEDVYRTEFLTLVPHISTVDAD